jgi:hypothetical protein
MSTSGAQRLAERISALEGQVRATKVPQLAFSSLEGGAITEYDETGEQVVALYGQQHDGTHVAASLFGPTPPAPASFVVLPVAGGLKVRWFGYFVDDAIVPMDFTRAEVHVSQQQGFDALTADTLRHSFETPRGGEVTISLAPGVWYVRLVSRTQSGKASPPSEEIAGTAALIQADDVADFALTVKKMQSLRHQLY